MSVTMARYPVSIENEKNKNVNIKMSEILFKTCTQSADIP